MAETARADPRDRPAAMKPSVRTRPEFSKALGEAVHPGISGFVVADLAYRPIYANDAALQILEYSSQPSGPADWEASVQKRLQTILQSKQYAVESVSLASFVSGRRQYVCRPFLLQMRGNDGRPPLVAVMMDRPATPRAALPEACRRYHLSPREYETVQHLSLGLTTKEIAQRMNVSPNTVKQFVRLVMSKMSVTTRSGVLGRLLAS